MTNTELLTEAIECSPEDWWDEFGSIDEAIKVVTGAIKESPDEQEVAILLSLLEPEDNEFEDGSPLISYRKCLKKIKKELREIKNELYQ